MKAHSYTAGAAAAGPLPAASRWPSYPFSTFPEKILLVLDACNEECESILKGFSRYQKDHGAWNTFVDDRGVADRDPTWLTSQPWRGVISRSTTPGLVEACARLGVPLVDLNDCAPFPSVPKIRPNNIAIGHMAAEDLHERGYQHLYFCGYANRLWSQERRDGFFEALSLLECPAGELLLPHPPYTPPPAEQALMVQDIAAWLRSLPRPAAVMAAHDMLGRSILDAAQAAGLNVPEEIAVLSVNNEQTRCEIAFPPLSSIALDSCRAGYLAAQQLAQLLQGGAPTVPEVRVDPLHVVTRRSTDCLAIPDRAISAALAIVRQEACHGLTVADLLRKASISRGKLERGFRGYIGRSPQAEIRRVQLSRIKQLLIETNLPLKQIADLTGFEHVEYLSVSFKRATGETPGRYRLKTQAGSLGAARARGGDVSSVPTAA